MVKETEYEKRLAAEKSRLEQENYDGKNQQDINWQAWVNVQKEKMKEQQQRDHEKSQLSAEQRRQEDQRDRLKAQELAEKAERRRLQQEQDRRRER